MNKRQARQLGYSGQPLGAVQPIRVGPPSFIGGRNVDWGPNMQSGRKSGGVLPTQCIQLDNFDIDPSGHLVARAGSDKLNSTAIDSGSQIRSLYRYYKASTQAKYEIMHVGTKIGTVNLSTGAFTDGTAGLTIPVTPTRWLTWNDMAYGFNGTGILKFDGTTFSQIQASDADCPDSIHGTVLDEVLFTARDGAAAPSRVPYGDDLTAETWTATSFRRIRDRDAGIIMSLFTGGNRILCIKNLSVFWLHGSSIYDFAEELITDNIGQIGLMASDIYEDKVFFQSSRGIEYFDASSPKLFNNIARGTCSEEITGYSRSQRVAAVMRYWPKKNRLFVSYPTLATPLIYVFFLNHPNVDEDGNIWFPHTVYKGLTVTAMGIVDADGDNCDLYFGTDAGFIYKYDVGWSDEGTAITALAEWGFTHGGVPERVKNFSHAIIPAKCTGTFTVALNVDFSKRIDSVNSPIYLAAGTALWGSGIWGTSKWSGGSILSRTLRFHKMNGQKASLKISRSNAEHFEIHPFLLEFTPKEIQRWP